MTTNDPSLPVAAIDSRVEILVAKQRLLLRAIQPDQWGNHSQVGSTGLRNGLEVSAPIHLQEKSTLQHLPIIPMAGAAKPDKHALCLRAGLATSLSKPFTVAVLYAAID
jgi:hypothetical protein